MTKYIFSDDSDAVETIERMDALSLLGLRIHAPVHLLTYLRTYLHRATSVLCDWPVI